MTRIIAAFQDQQRPAERGLHHRSSGSFDVNRRRKLMLLAEAALAGVMLSMPAAAQDSASSQRTGVSRADLFIASFGPAASEPALRTSELQMRERVRLAFYGIDATRIEVEKGRLSKEEGDFIIDAGVNRAGSYMQTLRNYIHDHSNEALILASSGQAQDIPRIAQALGALMGVARQDALMGREEAAQQAQAKMVETL